MNHAMSGKHKILRETTENKIAVRQILDVVAAVKNVDKQSLEQQLYNNTAKLFSTMI